VLSAKGASSPYNSRMKSPPWAKEAGKGAERTKQPPKPGKKPPSALKEVAGEDAPLPAPKKAKATKGKGGGRPAADQQCPPRVWHTGKQSAAGGGVSWMPPSHPRWLALAQTQSYQPCHLLRTRPSARGPALRGPRLARRRLR
jgi:hypothetical protein